MVNKSSNIAIVILAAGASSRMGEPKQLLAWGENTLLGHAIKTVLETRIHPVYVVLGANYDSIKKEIEHLPVKILRNQEWHLGLGNSIACASREILNSETCFDGVLFVLGDQPFVTKAFLNDLIKNFEPEKKQIIVTAYKETKKGVPAIFDKTYFKDLLLLNGKDGAKQLIRDNSPFLKTIMPPFKNIDLDTQEEYLKHVFKQH